MLRRLVTFIVMVPLAALIIALAMANRQLVSLSFDPFGSVDPALSVSVPLFVFGFGALIAGVIVGGAAAWLVQHKWRRAARRLRGEIGALRREHEALQRRTAVAQPRHPIAHRPPAA